jgi:transcriptional regulator with XRE-family HTH domain
VKKTIYDPAYQHFCKLLIEARQKQQLLQAQLAKKLHKPQSFVSRVESGQRPLDVLEFLHYTQVLKADPYEMLQTLEKLINRKASSKASRQKKAK